MLGDLFGKGVTGCNLHSGNWGNLLGEISEEGSTTDEVGVSSLGLSLSGGFPSTSGVQVGLGGGEKGGLAGYGEFSSTDGSGVPGISWDWSWAGEL